MVHACFFGSSASKLISFFFALVFCFFSSKKFASIVMSGKNSHLSVSVNTPGGGGGGGGGGDPRFFRCVKLCS